MYSAAVSYMRRISSSRSLHSFGVKKKKEKTVNMTKQLIKQLLNFQIKNNKAVLRGDIYLKLIVDKWLKMAIC